MLNRSSQVDGVPEAIDCLTLIRSLGGPGGIHNFSRAAQQVLGGIDSLDYREEDSNCTALGVVRYGRFSILVCHGTDLDSQYVPEFVQFIGNVIGGNAFSNDNPDAGWTLNAAQKAYTLMNGISGWDTEAVWTTGHSAGHGIGTEAIDLLAQTGPYGAQRFRSVSFGGNGWANVQKRNRLTNFCQTMRWMNDDDPVPLFPWCVAQMLQGISAITSAQLRFIRAFVHVGAARSLFADGHFVNSLLPANAVADPGSSVVGWLKSMESGLGNTHKTSEYLARLQAAIVPPVTPDFVQPPEPADTGAQPPLSLPVVDTIAEGNSVIPSLIAAAEARVEAEPPVVPTVLPGFRFKAEHVPGGWAVTMGPVVLDVGKSKRHARSVARLLNQVFDDEEKLGNPALLQEAAFLKS